MIRRRWMTGALVLLMAVSVGNAVTIQLDYTYDGGWFASRPQAVTAMEKAAAAYQPLMDSLSAIEPSGGNTWNAIITQPDTGAELSISNPTIPADTLVVYVGARDLGAGTLGRGGPGGFGASGSGNWLETVGQRGQSGEDDTPATDFGPWGGSIAFDDGSDWNFDVNSLPTSGQSDFYSVAVHELAHVLGFGLSDSWYAHVDDELLTFDGAASMVSHGGAVDLDPYLGHWKDNILSEVGGASQEAAMAPFLTTGTRKRLTALDYAGLADIGWELPLRGDVDLDGRIDFDDAWALLGSLGDGRIDHAWSEGDLDGDGEVDGDDAAIMVAAWNGPTPPAALMSAVPEPGVFVVVMLGGLAILSRPMWGRGSANGSGA
ncbi:MAG: matrixin family metalloprotease [Planctomycetota bacterium]